MSRIELLRKEIQNECEKNKYLQDILQNFECIRDEILDRIDLFYNPYSLFTSDSEYSSSDDDILNESSDSDDAEFYVSKKAKQLAKSASKMKLLSQSTSTNLGKQNASPSKSPVKKPSSNQSHPTSKNKKATSSPTKTQPNPPNQLNQPNLPNPPNQHQLFKLMQAPDVMKAYNISVQAYDEMKKNMSNQNEDQQISSKPTSYQAKYTPQSFTTFLKNMALMNQQSFKNQTQQRPNQKQTPVLPQAQQKSNQKQNLVLPQIQQQKNQQQKQKTPRLIVCSQITNQQKSSEKIQLESLIIQPPPIFTTLNQTQHSIPNTDQNFSQQQIDEINKPANRVLTPRIPLPFGFLTTSTNNLPQPQIKPIESEPKQMEKSQEQQVNLLNLKLNMMKDNANQISPEKLIMLGAQLNVPGELQSVKQMQLQVVQSALLLKIKEQNQNRWQQLIQQRIVQLANQLQKLRKQNELFQPLIAKINPVLDFVDIQDISRLNENLKAMSDEQLKNILKYLENQLLIASQLQTPQK